MTAIPQHTAARFRANEVRQAIADHKQNIRDHNGPDGARLVAQTVLQDHTCELLGSTRIGPLLKCIFRFGDSKAERVLDTARVASEQIRLRDLSRRQREAIASQLHLWAEGYGR